MKDARHRRVGRVVHRLGPAVGYQLAVDEHLADIDVAKQAAVAVGLVYVPDHADRLAVDKGVVGRGRLAATRLTRFRRVDADVADAPGRPVEVNDDGVAVDDAGDSGDFAG